MFGLNWTNKLCKAFFGAANDNSAQHAQGVRYETPRLVLREIKADDVQRVHEISNAPGFFYYCFDGSLEKAQAFVDKAIQTQTPDPKTGYRSDVMLAVCEAGSDVMIGHVSLEAVDYVEGIGYEPNFFMDPNHQSTGYGREAVTNLMHHGFALLNVDQYTATAHPDNVRSQNVIKTLGFRKVADITMDTTKGPEPRELYTLTQDDFYVSVAAYGKPVLPDLPPHYKMNAPVRDLKR